MLYAVTSSEAMVVTYMKIAGKPAYSQFLPTDESHTVTSTSDSAAMSWLAPPKSCQRYTHVPVSISRIASAMQIRDATCWLRHGGKTSPSHSESVTRCTRNSSCVTTRTMTMKAANASEVAYASGMPHTLMKPPRPVPKAATGAPLAPTDTARRARRPSRNSANIEPPPTGSMSASLSTWRAVPTAPNSACQPEIAPHAIVTKSIGQSGITPAGPSCGLKPLKAGSTNTATSGLTNDATAAPARPRTIASAVIQNPT